MIQEQQKASLPTDFVNEMNSLLGSDEASELVSAIGGGEQPVSIRRNPLKTSGFAQLGIATKSSTQPVPWSDTGVYLSERPLFTLDPHIHAGAYYVQEASSMFVEHVLRTHISEPSVVLDLCAAPGGKSIAALSALPEGSLLVSNEIMRGRCQILAENLTKNGSPSTIVTNCEASDFQPLGSRFDVVITDVPCSGEGMFRKDERAVSEWSLKAVADCQERARGIVADIWPCLKPGGLLIFSTCTYNRAENEDNVLWIATEFGAEILTVPTDEEWNIRPSVDPSVQAYRFMPHRTTGEGFFIAVLQKSPEAEVVSPEREPKKNKKDKNRQTLQPVPRESASMLANPSEYTIHWAGEQLIAFPTNYMDILESIRRHCRIMTAGITLGRVKGKNLQPAHSLAMSAALSPEAFPRTELTLEQSLAYLRGESISLSASVSLGHVVVCYQDLPLGFVKNLGNRANNLYPQEWRIRMQVQ